MAPDTPNNQYVEAVSDYKKQEKSLRGDMDSFDERALRKMYREKLDAAVKGRTLSPAELKKYHEAQRKIDDNIKKLKQMRDYLLAKGRVTTLEQEVIQWKEKNPSEDFMYQINMAGLNEVMDFRLKMKPPLGIKSSEYLKDMDKSEVFVDGLAKAIQKYYVKRLPQIGKESLRQIDRASPDSGLSLLDYDNAEYEMAQIDELLEDKQKFEKLGYKSPKVNAVCAAAGKRAEKIKGLLPEVREYLNKEDLKLVEGTEAVDRAIDWGDKNALSWGTQALNERGVEVSRQSAKKAQDIAMARSFALTSTYHEAEDLMTQAGQLQDQNDLSGASKKYAQAARLYMEEAEKGDIEWARLNGEPKGPEDKKV
jgi:hypothetical protein